LAAPFSFWGLALERCFVQLLPVNRKELQSLANIRLREAQVLLKAGEYSGAYYLAGYAIECGLKACIAKHTKRHDFPDKKLVNDSYTHVLAMLVKLAHLEQDRLNLAQNDPPFRKNWDLVTLWSEKSRYSMYQELDCRDFLDAVANKNHGVMPWIRQRW
jgi:hypothetical protein